jgi:hypothetical protein
VPEVIATKPEPATERRQIAKPAPRTEPAPTPNLPAAAAQPAPSEAPVVRATPAASGADEKKVRDLLTKASSDLAKRVDFQKLSDEGKKSYNESKRFSEQAEQAIKERNFPYALSLAEKAATLAAELIR